MGVWTRLLLAASAPLVLAGCLWGPGKFQSELALRKDGTFVLDYRGEILLQLPDGEAEAAPWKEDMIRCYADGRVETVTPVPAYFDDETGQEADTDRKRACTPAETADARAAYEKKEAVRVAAKRDENDQMAKVLGLPGGDDESNRRFAANLMKQQGWKSVTYKGKGLFDVVYRFQGSARQDYAFPLMPDSDLLIPFITIRPRSDGSVKVTAPALVGGAGIFAARAKAMSLPGAAGKDGPASRAQGRFTIVTDGEILTNNSEDGPQPHAGGRQVSWDVGVGSDKVPELMVRL